MFYLKKAIFASKMDFIDEFYKNSVIYLVPGTCVFDSHKDVASGKIPVFGNILGFPGINWAQKWTKTFNFGYVSFPLKPLILKDFLDTALVLWETTSGRNFSKIVPYLG